MLDLWLLMGHLQTTLTAQYALPLLSWPHSGLGTTLFMWEPKKRARAKEGWGLWGERREPVRACVEVTQVCRIIINNLPSFLIHGKKKKGSGEEGDNGVWEEWRGGWSRVGKGQPLASKNLKPSPYAIFKFSSFSTAWGNLEVSIHQTACERKGIRHMMKTTVFTGKERWAP